jgi:hypothetical protein
MLFVALVSAEACHPQPRAADASKPAAPAAASYDAPGSGHLLREVAENGRFIALEDGSRWEIHPRDRFRTIDWEPDSGISVRTTRDDDGYGYGYEIVNTSLDDGALARLRSNHSAGTSRQIPNPESRTD